MNLVNTGLAAELDQSSIGRPRVGAFAPCLVSIIHPDRDAGGQGMPAKQKERHGCLSFLSVGSFTIFQGELLSSSSNTCLRICRETGSSVMFQGSPP